MNAKLKIAVVLFALCVVFVFGGVWWWALLGMTPEVGGAVMLSALLALVLGCVFVGWSTQ